jgi:hypothetical protein
MRKPTHVEIDTIWVDASLRETYSYGAEVTEHPVEQGADVADHIRPRSRVLSIEAVVTNTPIEVPGSHADGTAADASPLELQGEPTRTGGPYSYKIEGEPSVGAVGLIPSASSAQRAPPSSATVLRARSRPRRCASLRSLTASRRCTALCRTSSRAARSCAS